MSTNSSKMVTLKAILGGLCGLVSGVALALLWHLVTLFIFVRPYSDYWGDVYAIIIDCFAGGSFGTLSGICITHFCPREKRFGFLLGLAAVILLVPAVAWDVNSYPTHMVIDGSTLSFDPLTNGVWYLLLLGLPVLSVGLSFLCRPVWLRSLVIGLAVLLIAYGFFPATFINSSRQ